MWDNFEFEILVNITPIIVINLLITIIIFIFCSFLVLSLNNKLIFSQNLTQKKVKVIHFFVGFITLIFILTEQVIFNSLLNSKEINNINNIVDPDLLNLRDQFLLFSTFLIHLFFITALMLKTSFFHTFPTLFLIIGMQFIFSGLEFELISQADIIFKMVIFLCFFFLYWLVLRIFFKSKILKIAIVTIIFGIFLFVINIFSNLIFNLNNVFLFEWFFIIITAMLFFFICYTIIDNIYNRISKANILRNNILFDKFGFIRSSYAEEYFKKWVIKNKISHGYIFLIKLNNENFINKKLGSKKSHIIMSKVINNIILKIKNNYLFFRGFNGEFYFYSKQSNFKKISKEIINLQYILPKKIFLKNEEILLNFNFYGAKYGFDANHFKGLISCLKEATKNKGFNTNQFLIMYKYKEKWINLKEWQNFEFLKSKIKIETLQIKLIQKNFIWDVIVNINSKKIFNLNELINKIDDFETQKLVVRYIAFHALKIFSYEKGVINLPYMAQIFESKNFDWSFFLRVINMIGIRYDCINLKFIDKKINIENPIYEQIKKIGINF